MVNGAHGVRDAAGTRMRRGGPVRDAWLDGLRALAALMVFAWHASPAQYIGGWDAGVLVFYSLSGYLLYRPFVEGPVNLSAYAIRRLLRIYPAYLVAAVGIAWLHGYPFDLAGVVTMSQTPVIVAWTLQIEVVFYAALPLIAWIAGGRPAPIMAMAAASLLFAGASMLGTGVMPVGFASWAWAFVPGMLVAQLAVRHPGSLEGAARPAIPLVGVALMAVSVVPDIRFPDVPAAVGSALILAWLLTRPAPGPMASRLMLIGGALSYSLYLWHEALMMWDRPPTLPGALASLAVSLCVASLVYALVERPAIRFARRITRRSARVDAIHPVAADPSDLQEPLARASTIG